MVGARSEPCWQYAEPSLRCLRRGVFRVPWRGAQHQFKGVQVTTGSDTLHVCMGFRSPMVSHLTLAVRAVKSLQNQSLDFPVSLQAKSDSSCHVVRLVHLCIHTWQVASKKPVVAKGCGRIKAEKRKNCPKSRKAEKSKSFVLAIWREKSKSRKIRKVPKSAKNPESRKVAKNPKSRKVKKSRKVPKSAKITRKVEKWRKTRKVEKSKNPEKFRKVPKKNTKSRKVTKNPKSRKVKKSRKVPKRAWPRDETFISLSLQNR